MFKGTALGSSQFLTSDCHPIATKSRSYSKDDRDFMEKEVTRLYNERKISKSHSPWRSQPFIVKKDQYEEDPDRRMVIDYSRTINKFTMLDAYPLPKISEIVNNVAHFKVLSSLDLKRAYHQIPLHPDDRPYTAFQVNDELYEWNVLPFGITNGVPCFQRFINEFIKRHNMQTNVFAYLDNITVGGNTQEEHDKFLQLLLDAAKKEALVFNEKKSQFSSPEVALLGYVVGGGQIKPDPERASTLMKLPVPTNKKELDRVIGFFAYYARWIQNYSEKIQHLIASKQFPLGEEAKKNI